MNAKIKETLEIAGQNNIMTADYTAMLQLKDHRIAWNEKAMTEWLGDDFAEFKKDCHKRPKGKTKSLLVTKNAA